MPIRPRMSLADVREYLQAASSCQFSSVVVYLKPYRKANGNFTSQRGAFHHVFMENTYWGTRQDDWSIEDDMYYNRNWILVKPVHVTFDPEKTWFFKATLFCRVKMHAPAERINDIVSQLNGHLDLFKDELREDIAQEWCAQEPWRMYPYKAGPFNDPRVSIYGILYDANPIEDDLGDVMDYLLPSGYDEDTSGRDII